VEAALRPAGRVRMFFLPREMEEAERRAWLAEHTPDLRPEDRVVFLRWLGEGERPAEEVGEAGRRPADRDDRT
jgi:hypothetical protein